MVGMSEILVIVLILILTFGASQIPKVARSVGEGLKELKKAVREAKEYDDVDEEKKKNV